MNNKDEQWANELKTLSSVATTQPHTAHATLTHGQSSKWTFSISSIGHLLLPLEDIFRFHFIPALTRRPSHKDSEHELLALPAQLGSIAVINPNNLSQTEYSAASEISQPLTGQIFQQLPTYPPHIKEQLTAKATNKSICNWPLLSSHLSHQPFSMPCHLLRRRASQTGSPPSHMRSSDSPYLKEPSREGFTIQGLRYEDGVR